MEANQLHTQITSNGLQSLLDEGKKRVVLQILQPERIGNSTSERLKYKIFISDGSARQRAVLGNNAALAFESAGSPQYCLIRVIDIMQNFQFNKRLIIITQMEIINAEVSMMIGRPMEYDRWILQYCSQLTVNGVESLVKEGKRKVILQVLRDQYRRYISDGFTYHKAIFSGNSASTLSGLGSNVRCVVCINEVDIIRSVHNVLTVLDVEIINPYVTDIIGEPIEFETWIANNRQNPRGNNKFTSSSPPDIMSRGNYEKDQDIGILLTRRRHENFIHIRSTENRAENFRDQENQILSPEGVFSLLMEGQKNKFLQLLDLKEVDNENNFGVKYQGFISDGIIKHKAFIGTEASLQLKYFQVFPSCQPVVSVDDFITLKTKEDKTIVIITRINSIQPHITTVIGNPKEKKGILVSVDLNKLLMKSGFTDFDETKAGFHRDSKLIPHLPKDLIAQLDPECMGLNKLTADNPFIIKVRVIRKSGLKEKRGSNGGKADNKLFSVDLMDQEGYTITMNFVKEAADHFFTLVQLNKIYIIATGIVKTKLDIWNNQQNYIVIEKSDGFIGRVEDETDFPFKFNFVCIKNIPNIKSPYIDVVGFVSRIGPCEQVTLKYSLRTRSKRVISVYDQSETSVEITLWDALANNVTLENEQLIVIKDARVLNPDDSPMLFASSEARILFKQSELLDDPVINQLQEFKKITNDKKLRIFSISMPRLYFTIEQIKEKMCCIHEDLSLDLIAHVTNIKIKNALISYDLDPNHSLKCSGCGYRTKISSHCQNQSICTVCGERIDHWNRLCLKVSIEVSDHTGSLGLDIFGSAAAVILQCNPRRLPLPSSSSDKGIYEEYKFTLLLSPAFDGTKIKTKRVEKINYAKQIEHCLEQLDLLRKNNEEKC